MTVAGIRAVTPSNSPAAAELAEATKVFETKFGTSATHFGVAPGRIEVLGNHTDYNEGFILSGAIDRFALLVGRKTGSSKAKVYSAAFDSAVEFDTAAPTPAQGDAAWTNYIAGVVSELVKKGIEVGGFEAVIMSTVPTGGGVSSSAALELATCGLLQQLFSLQISVMDLVWTAKAAENNFVGMGCGVLDQFSSAFGKSGQLISLDCRDTSKYSYAPLATDVKFVLANTHAPHQLVDGKYNELRANCFEAAKWFGVSHLRDVTAEMFETKKGEMPSEGMRKRASHIVGENRRVTEGVAALESGNMELLGRLLSESHVSSRDDFGNSCPELDQMVAAAQGLPGHLGSRLMGGGFGGCTLNLVRADSVEAFCTALSDKYTAATGITTDFFAVSPGDGAHAGQL